MVKFSRYIVPMAAAGALLATINLGCAAKQPQVQDTWTAASQQASAAASRADAAAARAEAAASRAEASAERTEAAVRRVEDAAARMEARTLQRMRK
jgi:hypothetical protein